MLGHPWAFQAPRTGYGQSFLCVSVDCTKAPAVVTYEDDVILFGGSQQVPLPLPATPRGRPGRRHRGPVCINLCLLAWWPRGLENLDLTRTGVLYIDTSDTARPHVFYHAKHPSIHPSMPSLYPHLSSRTIMPRRSAAELHEV